MYKSYRYSSVLTAALLLYTKIKRYDDNGLSAGFSSFYFLGTDVQITFKSMTIAVEQ